MSAILKNTKILLAAILLTCPIHATSRADATATGRPTAVKALLIGLTGDPHIGRGVAEDLRHVESYVRGLPGFDADRDLKELTGSLVNADNILQAVEDLDVRPTDVLFCYYAGHGAYDPTAADIDPEGGHFFQIPGGDLWRDSLMDALKVKGARLTVLISETCNVAARFHAFRRQAEETEPQPEEAPALKPVASPALRTLLFDYTGVVDVNGASQDQCGICAPIGSLSTIGLVVALDAEDKSLADGDSHLTWERYLEDGSEAVHLIFQQVKEKTQDKVVKEQDDLRPETIHLDVRLVGQAG